VERVSDRWIAGVFGLVAVLLLPWAVFLKWRLPSHHVVRRWDTAWTGFDLALAIALVGLAVCLLRRSSWTQVVAAVAGTMLLCDAWFDLLTASPGAGLDEALVEALAAELPLAVACFLLARKGTLSLRLVKTGR
jgi:hypothetical protein